MKANHHIKKTESNSFIRRELKSFKNAINGILRHLASEKHAQYHALATLLVVIAGFTLSISKSDWIAITLCIASVNSAELYNSALEKLADRLHPEHHEFIGLAKDFAAGAVLIFSITSVIVGLLVFWEHLLILLK